MVHVLQLVDLSDSRFWGAVLIIIFNPLFWNVVSGMVSWWGGWVGAPVHLGSFGCDAQRLVDDYATRLWCSCPHGEGDTSHTSYGRPV